jgi:tRNA uridine 5-carbamoylmethylation protein Kti12
MKAGKLLGAVLVMVCVAAGCGFNPMFAVYDNNAKIAGDTNTYNLSNYEQVQSDLHFTASVGKMEGMDTIWVLDAEEDMTVDITYQLSVFSGKMKLVLIDPEKEVSVIVECDSEMEETVQSTLDVKKGNNRIKIVAAENTQFDIDMTLSAGGLKELG